ncbi:hypothetical protein ESCNG_240010 [Neisseria gonorrhoeae]|uniref:Uncharacterized protein n=1 Tax=Neisseria gonorrhoeae TaxID=485 RepID=A0AB74ER07_NEIGO|nr:hypothetical protein ESCNG_240010 [Neisseria gonorrhoeae]SCW13809.1 hypothetical protein ESCNG_320010 [Neisseria gonorrhoeae]SCW14714.1 hypothetical protein ESCNG_270010 [Neisseria gonorrhoeae]
MAYLDTQLILIVEKALAQLKEWNNMARSN